MGAPRTERRRHDRVAAKGTLGFRGHGHEQRGRIANVSMGGAYVRTKVGLPERMLARSVEIDLRFDGGDAEWLRATGKLVRLHPSGFALAFELPDSSLERALEALVDSQHTRTTTLSVVLIDSDRARLAAIAAGLRAAACQVLEASTPLEAIVRLGESDFEPDVVAIGDTYPARATAEMHAFLAQQHPGSSVLALDDELLQPDGISHWLSPASPAGDVATRVRDALALTKRRR